MGCYESSTPYTVPMLASRKLPVVQQHVIGPERPTAKRQAAPDHVRDSAAGVLIDDAGGNDRIEWRVVFLRTRYSKVELTDCLCHVIPD